MTAESDEEREWAANERRLALMCECALAGQNQRVARRVVPEYPPPCDGWLGGEEGVEL